MAAMTLNHRFQVFFFSPADLLRAKGFSLWILFAEFAVIGGRLANLFTFCYWILWIDLLKCIALPNNRRLYVGYLVVYCLLKVFGTAVDETFYYDNLLTGSKSYEERIYIYSRIVDNDEE